MLHYFFSTRQLKTVYSPVLLAKIILATTILSTIVGLEYKPAEATILINGSFETGNTTGWTSLGNLETIGKGNHPCCVPSEGILAVSFNGGNQTPNGILSQTFLTQAGSQYRLSFDFGKGSLGSGTAALNVQVNGITNLLNQTVNDDSGSEPVDYVNFSYSFLANSANTTLIFTDVSIGTDSFDTLLDNVVVTAANSVSVPEPKSIAMLAAVISIGLITFLKQTLSKNYDKF